MTRLFDPDLARVDTGRLHLERLVLVRLIERNAFGSSGPRLRLRKRRFPTHDLARRHHDRVPAGPPRSARRARW